MFASGFCYIFRSKVGRFVIHLNLTIACVEFKVETRKIFRMKFLVVVLLGAALGVDSVSPDCVK